MVHFRKFSKIVLFFCVGSISLPLLYTAVDGLVIWLTNRSLNVHLYPILDSFQYYVHLDSLSYDFDILLLCSATGAMTGVLIALYIILYRRESS